MTTAIAVAGKGGTGKTTLAAFLIEYLVQLRRGPVLAIDADPSTNLDVALGVRVEETIGDMREETLELIQRGGDLAGMDKPSYIDMRVQEALVEEEGFDLLAMGRPEGPGCYCAANNFLRLAIDRLAQHYRYVVIDTEAGLEHLSRRTTRDLDHLLIVADMSMRSLFTAQRIADLVDELHIRVDAIHLVVNRVPPSSDGTLHLPPTIAQTIEQTGIPLLGLLPLDPLLATYDAEGRPFTALPADSAFRQAALESFQRLEL